MPLAKNKWAALPKAQRGKLNYQQYVTWANKKTAQRKAAKVKKAGGGDPGGQWIGDPALAPMDPASLLASSKATVHAQLAPVIIEIQNAIARQRRQGIQDINHSTTQAVNALTPIPGQLAETWGGAQNEQTRVDKSIVDFLKGQGKTTGSDVDTQLAAAGAPASTGPGLSGLGAGMAQGALGYGSSTASRMASDRASEVGYAQKQPGIMRSVGSANIQGFSKKMADALATDLGQVTQQTPGLVNTTYQALLDREYNKAVARQGFQMDQAKLTAATSGGADQPTIDTAASNNANDGLARDSSGQLIPNGQGGYVGWNPKTDPTTDTAPGSKFDKMLKGSQREINTTASNLHKALMKTIQTPVISTANPIGEKPSKAAVQALVTKSREHAVAAVRAYWDQHYPGQTQEWRDAQAVSTLIQAGYPNGAKMIDPKADVSAVTNAGGGGTPATGPQVNVNLPGTGSKTRFVAAVADRTNYLAKNVPIKKAYGQLVNYILATAGRLHYPMSPQVAQGMAQHYLAAKGLMNTETMVGNPRKMDPTYRQFVGPNDTAVKTPGSTSKTQGYTGSKPDTTKPAPKMKLVNGYWMVVVNGRPKRDATREEIARRFGQVFAGTVPMRA